MFLKVSKALRKRVPVVARLCLRQLPPHLLPAYTGKDKRAREQLERMQIPFMDSKRAEVESEGMHLPELDLDSRAPKLHVSLTGDYDPVRSPLSQSLYGAHSPRKAYGEIGYLLPDEVREIAQALRDYDETEVRRRCLGWEWGGGLETIEEVARGVVDDFYLLRSFFAAAAAEGHAVVFIYY